MRAVVQNIYAIPIDWGRRLRDRLPEEGLYRTVCDYVAGMTDRYLIDE